MKEKKHSISATILYSILIFIASQLISVPLSYFWLKFLSNEDLGMGNGILLMGIYLFLTILFEILGIIFIKRKFNKTEYNFKIIIILLTLLNLILPMFPYVIGYYIFSLKSTNETYKQNGVLILEDTPQVEYFYKEK